MRLLVIEDDLVIASELERALRKAGHKADVAHDGESGLQLALGSSYSAVILDVMLPRIDGWEVCNRLRKAGQSVPILMLTAKDTVGDRVKGLDQGADDYLVKPFAFQELLARLRAITRRDSQNKAEMIEIDDMVIDPAAKSVLRSGTTVSLTPREYTLLEALARHEGQTLTRDAILERVWNNDESLPTSVNFHMSSLRKKIDPPEKKKLIHTVHGFGYVLRRPEGD